MFGDQLDRLNNEARLAFAPKVPVLLGMRWAPVQDATIMVVKVTVGGLPVPSLTGTEYSTSPQALPIGSYPAGSKITVGWEILALYDVLGIQMSVRADNGKWKSAKAKAPFPIRTRYSSTITYSIPPVSRPEPRPDAPPA